MQTTHNTLSENIRTQTAEILNRHLAAAIDLHGQFELDPGFRTIG